MTLIQASILSNCRIDSNRIEKSIRQRESNRIEFFSPESECSNINTSQDSVKQSINSYTCTGEDYRAFGPQNYHLTI